VDEEVKNILTHAYARRAYLSERRAALDRLAAALLERETLEREQVEMVIAGQTLPPYVRRQHHIRADGEAEKERVRGERTSGGILRNPPLSRRRDRSASGRPFKLGSIATSRARVKRALARVLWLSPPRCSSSRSWWCSAAQRGAGTGGPGICNDRRTGRRGGSGSVAVVANGIVARTRRVSAKIPGRLAMLNVSEGSIVQRATSSRGSTTRTTPPRWTGGSDVASAKATLIEASRTAIRCSAITCVWDIHAQNPISCRAESRTPTAARVRPTRASAPSRARGCRGRGTAGRAGESREHLHSAPFAHGSAQEPRSRSGRAVVGGV